MTLSHHYHFISERFRYELLRIMRPGCNEWLRRYARGIRACGVKEDCSFIRPLLMEFTHQINAPMRYGHFIWSDALMVRQKEANVINRSSVSARLTRRSRLLVLSGVLKKYERESLLTKLKRRILKK